MGSRLRWPHGRPDCAAEPRWQNWWDASTARDSALTIAAGRGRKPTYDQEGRSQSGAADQGNPDRREEGTATWSLSTLERRLRRDGLTKVGATTIRRVLHEAGASWQRSRTWCPTGTAQRKRKSGMV